MKYNRRIDRTRTQAAKARTIAYAIAREAKQWTEDNSPLLTVAGAVLSLAIGAVHAGTFGAR